MKRLLFSCVLSLMTLSGICQINLVSPGIYYKKTSSTEASVSKTQRGVKGKIVIPHTVRIGGKKYKVTSISDGAFANRKRITSVIIPNSITRIGRNAFAGCYNLTSVTIPNDVEFIGFNEFGGCSRLSSITMPGWYADRIDRYVAKQLVSVKLTEGTTKIEFGVFDDYSALKYLSIPNSVKSIERYSFYDCKNLKELVVPDNKIDNYYEDNIFCVKDSRLQSICGHNIPYPSWAIERLAKDEAYAPIGKWAKDIQKLYSYYAYERIIDKMTVWQQKKEYETTAQWQVRVTEETRADYLKTVQKQVLAEFIAQKRPVTLKGNIGHYDADYGVFPITASDLGTFYLQVPMEDAPIVKSEWNQAIVVPTYGVVEDRLAVISAEVKVNGKTYTTAEKYENTVSDIAVNLPPLEINLSNDNAAVSKPDIVQTIDQSIDLNIPKQTSKNTRSFAVIIGNENYKEAAKVPYALNDAKVFASYCEKTLGLPQKNIKCYEDATFGTILSAIENLQSIAKAYKGNINAIFYYAGHGIPDEISKEAYLLPVDANGRNTAACYPINKLYGELEALGANQVTVFLDACFSGAQRGNGMLASARGVAIAAKETTPQGNMVVFSAASADETAYPYNEKRHGLFTYYLLKKLNETKGDVTLGELGSYICEKVAQESVVTNGKSQTPTVMPSVDIIGSWKKLKLIE